MAAKKKTQVPAPVAEEVVVTTETVEEVVESKEIVDESTEVIDVSIDASTPVVHKRMIITNVPTVFRKTTSLEPKYIMGTMPVGIPYEIIREARSKIYGNFYQLSNGYYITQGGNYSIN